jgi:phospholipid/cholesterol/gamma-HCH transport system ATP-binding protein
MTAIQFTALPMGDSRADIRVPMHHSVAVTGDTEGGPDGLVGMALGLDPIPPGAQVLVLGEDVSALKRRDLLAFRRRVGYVPAGDGLMQNLSLAENVALPLRFGSPLTSAAIASRLKVVLAVVRLGGAATLRPADADVDQRRRAAVARALVFDPALVVMAQPFDGLSARSAAELLETVRGGEVAEGGRRTVFIVGSDLPDRIRPRLEAVYRVAHGTLTPNA